jgi:hypothetical protein
MCKFGNNANPKIPPYFAFIPVRKLCFESCEVFRNAYSHKMRSHCTPFTDLLSISIVIRALLIIVGLCYKCRGKEGVVKVRFWDQRMSKWEYSKRRVLCKKKKN